MNTDIFFENQVQQHLGQDSPARASANLKGNWHPAPIGFRWRGWLNYLGLQCVEETMGTMLLNR